DDGITILPELATRDLAPKQKLLIHHFRPPAPVREVSLVTHRNYLKKRLITALRQEVLATVPKNMYRPKNKRIVEIKGIA
ncbi:MAG TPA: hydrogen peroxide-inducible genes activator, partial [Cyclobacteriaceae bacterium]|nr:hydrogen peroxide-inducible genes activator [Cyclobacteriaceae bacterium]